MENEILIALLTKLVDEKISQLPVSPGPRGHSGRDGRDGDDGKDFIFADHEPTIRQWAKDFALKFENLSEEQINLLRGPRGRDGNNGQPGVAGKDFLFADHAETIRQWAEGAALKFEDLTASDVEKLRGPRGRDGQDGRSFIFEENKNDIEEIIRGTVSGLSDQLKLRFSDLDAEDIEKLRGPRGRDGRDGRDFNFDEHRDYFDSLRLKFSDLSDGEKESLKLHFSQLTEDEKNSLKLRFKDLTQDDIALIRGPRGPRGQRGSPGHDGSIGPVGPRGLPGLTGVKGLAGRDGQAGVDGQDAPSIVAIDIEQSDNAIVFIFRFSDGSEIRTDRVELPAPVNVFGGGGGGSLVGVDVVNFETRIDEVSSTLTYVGKAHVNAETDEPIWQIQRIETTGTETVIEFADGDAKFDNVWDDRGGLTYA